MALGRQGERQTDLMVGWAELPRSPGHAFYDRLQAVLVETGFDGFAEAQCALYHASKLDRPSLPPGRYFRMHLVADKGYHSRDGLKELEDGAWKSRIAEKKVTGVSRWRGDKDARRAVYNNRARLRSGAAKDAFKRRTELVERSFALTLDRGGMRRSWLRGRENLHKRYLVHVAGYNLGLIMRLLVGSGTPRELSARVSAHLLALTAADTTTAILSVATGSDVAMLLVSVETEPHA
jgi:transposase